MSNKQSIFNLIHIATGVSMAPCDIMDIIDHSLEDVEQMTRETPNDYELGRKIREYITKRPFRDPDNGANDELTKT